MKNELDLVTVKSYGKTFHFIWTFDSKMCDFKNGIGALTMNGKEIWLDFFS